MARERSPDRDKAKLMWLESGGEMKLKDIAAALSVGETQIRKWKSQDGWAVELNSNVTNESDSNVTKRRGPPKGNKNAVGNRGGAPPGNKRAVGNKGGKGGPFGNKKAVTTGEYESIWLDALEDDERGLVDLIDTDPIQQADEAIMKFEIRERRMLLRIKRLTDGLTERERRVLYELKSIKEAMTVHDEMSGKTKTIPVTRTELVESEVEEKTYRQIDDIISLEEALTRVQTQKLKAIEMKARLLDEEKHVRIEMLKHELMIKRGGTEPDEVEDDGFMDALRGRAAEVWTKDDNTEA